MASELNQQENLSDNGLSVHHYDPSLHLADLNNILLLRGLQNEVGELPVIGFCVYLHGVVPVSFVFLRKIEGGSMLMDSMVTNPNQFPWIRDIANNKVVAEAIKFAKKQKVPSILAVSKDANTLLRSRSHGFVLLEEYQVIVASLLGKEL